MKRYENEEIWKSALGAIKVFRNNKHQCGELTDEDIKNRCSELAAYDCNDKEISKSKLELRQMEDKGEIFNSHLFIRLARHFYLEEVIEKKNTSEERILMETLHAFLGNHYYFETKSEVFSELYTLGYKYPQKYDTSVKNDIFINRMADSAIYLKDEGFKIGVEKDSIKYDHIVEQNIFSMLEKKIEAVGGVYILKEIMNEYINKNYIPSIERFYISRKSNNKRNEPLNLLINLAVKHLNTDIRSNYGVEKLDSVNKIIRLAEAWLDISDIQGTSSIEYSMFEVQDFPYYLKNEMIFEKMCIPAQYTSKFILLLLENLIKPWFDLVLNSEKNYKYEEYRKIAEYILNQKKHFGSINIYDIKKKTNFAKYKIESILKDISIPKRNVNLEFTSLEGKVNLCTRPLISDLLNNYIFINQHFTGIGFFIAAHEMIKQKKSDLDRVQGPIVEEILRNEMKAKGYDYLYGKYKEKNGLKESDCDVILQGEKINFLEVKKKSATEEFNLIDDVSMLKSLSYGMIRAQKQAFSHELYMRKNKGMQLQIGSMIKKVLYDENQFPAVKISICLPEYSFLTSSAFSRRLIELLVMAKISSVEEVREKDLDNLNNYGEQIRKIIELINEGKNIDIDKVGFFSLFCSLQQVLTAIWSCDNKEEFLEVVHDWIYTDDKNLDPYISLLHTISDKEDPQKRKIRDALKEFSKQHPYCKILRTI